MKSSLHYLDMRNRAYDKSTELRQKPHWNLRVMTVGTYSIKV